MSGIQRYGMISSVPIQILAHTVLVVLKRNQRCDKLFRADPHSTEDELEEKYSATPELTRTGPDPRSLHASEWRDKIRMLYESERLGLNFLSISFTYTENGDDERMDLLKCDPGICTRGVHPPGPVACFEDTLQNEALGSA